MVREKTYLLKLEFYITDRKMKSISRCIFVYIILHTNFMHFLQKVICNSALEIFTSVSGQLRTALSCLKMQSSLPFHFFCSSFTPFHPCISMLYLGYFYSGNKIFTIEKINSTEYMCDATTALSNSKEKKKITLEKKIWYGTHTTFSYLTL